MVAEIDLLHHTAVCWPLLGDEVNKEITISLKLAKLKGTEHPVTGKTKKVATKVVRDMIQATKLNMKCPLYRARFTKMQWAEFLLKEVSHAFWSPSRRRSFDLGLLSMEHDFDLLGLAIPDCMSAEFSYLRGSLSKLDDLLGPEWDIAVRDGVTRFVTVTRDTLSAFSKLSTQPSL